MNATGTTARTGSIEAAHSFRYFLVLHECCLLETGNETSEALLREALTETFHITPSRPREQRDRKQDQHNEDGRMRDRPDPMQGYVSDVLMQQIERIGAGELGNSVPRRSTSLAFIFGSSRAALISLLSRSTIGTGVALGTPIPYHCDAS